MRKLQDRVALVTGAAGGLGRALSLELAKAGCHLALVDVDHEGVALTGDLVRATGRRASVHLADVRLREDTQAATEQVRGEHGALHVLVNNAGVAAFGPFEGQGLADFERVLAINFMGPVYLCKALLPLLSAQDEAHIVNVSSLAALMGLPHQSAYSASKAALHSFSESLAAEFSTGSIGVTSVIPGGIRTGIVDAAQGDEARKQRVRHMLRGAAAPEQVASRIVAAVRASRFELVVCPEAHAMRWSTRLLPGGVRRVLAWNERRSALSQETRHGEHPRR